MTSIRGVLYQSGLPEDSGRQTKSELSLRRRLGAKLGTSDQGVRQEEAKGRGKVVAVIGASGRVIQSGGVRI